MAQTVPAHSGPLRMDQKMYILSAFTDDQLHRMLQGHDVPPKAKHNELVFHAAQLVNSCKQLVHLILLSQ